MNKKLPNLKDLELVRSKIKNIPNQKGEFLRKVHYGCFLLCLESGLRISEAVRFDLNTRTKKDLYRINKPKKQKKRLVYIPKKVISELKSQNWKPNQTNRWNFYHFLRKIKRELLISANIELTPHTLRRAFATYHAENGLPLPLLQKLLGHSSIRTTALYWRDIYGEDDTSDILAGKRWLEPKKPKTPSEITIPTENLPEQLPENLEPDIIRDKPLISAKEPNNQDNLLLPIQNTENPPTNYQPQLISEISKIPENFLLENQPVSQQFPANKKEPTQEQILLKKIMELEGQLKKIQGENTNLKIENKHLKELIKQEAKIIQILPFKVKN